MSNDPLARHPSLVSHAERDAVNGHKSAVVWFTGLPAADCASTVIDLLHTRGVVHPTLQRKPQ